MSFFGGTNNGGRFEMAGFSRGLGAELLARLQNERVWWPDVTAYSKLAIAIRHNYLNVYSNGQSIFRITTKFGDLVAETHYKYLVDEAKPEYRTFSNNKFDVEGLTYFSTYEGTETLDKLISNASLYAGREKEFVHQIIRRDENSNVIDLEVSFTTPQKAEAAPESEIEAEKEADKVGIDRIDMVALEENSKGSISIVFYEVKTFDDYRLRARGNAEVIGQLKDYEQAIAHKGDESIVRGYRQVCSDLFHLKRPVGKPGKINSLIERVATVAKDQNALEVDPNPRLIIVGYKDDQWDGDGWESHLRKLCTELGNDRIIGWGDDNNVQIGPEKLSARAGRRYRLT
jgi:hypothetical protein